MSEAMKNKLDNEEFRVKKVEGKAYARKAPRKLKLQKQSQAAVLEVQKAFLQEMVNEAERVQDEAKIEMDVSISEADKELTKRNFEQASAYVNFLEDQLGEFNKYYNKVVASSKKHSKAMKTPLWAVKRFLFGWKYRKEATKAYETAVKTVGITPREEKRYNFDSINTEAIQQAVKEAFEKDNTKSVNEVKENILEEHKIAEPAPSPAQARFTSEEMDDILKPEQKAQTETKEQTIPVKNIGDFDSRFQQEKQVPAETKEDIFQSPAPVYQMPDFLKNITPKQEETPEAKQAPTPKQEPAYEAKREENPFNPIMNSQRQEIEKLRREQSNLEDAKNDMSKESYQKERDMLDKYLTEAQNKYQETQKDSSRWESIQAMPKGEFDRIIPKDKEEKEAIEKEKERRLEEFRNSISSNPLPPKQSDSIFDNNQNPVASSTSDELEEEDFAILDRYSKAQQEVQSKEETLAQSQEKLQQAMSRAAKAKKETEELVNTLKTNLQGLERRNEELNSQVEATNSKIEQENASFERTMKMQKAILEMTRNEMTSENKGEIRTAKTM